MAALELKLYGDPDTFSSLTEVRLTTLLITYNAQFMAGILEFQGCSLYRITWR